MNEIKFRQLTPEDIEVRPATVKDGKATLLCYIDSRSVVELMDEAFGAMNWNFELVQVGDQMVGKMGVWDDEKKIWVIKSDVGSESNIEASKGLVSNIYKRCISRWGLQDLYTVPRIIIDDDGYGNHLKVSRVEWNNKRECTHITLVNKFGKVIFDWDAETGNKPVQASQAPATTETPLEALTAYCKEMKGQGDDKLLAKFYYRYKQIFETRGWKGTFLPAAAYKKFTETEMS